jgi:transcriptional regulator with XRE-family HTH domain
VQLVNKRQLPLTERSPFARRVLLFLRSFDPPIPEAELGRRIGVSRQTIHNWMWNISIPDRENVIALADELQCSFEDLELDLEASKTWEVPMAFERFTQLVEQRATSENWTDKDSILSWLRRTASWQNADSFWANLARDVLIQKVPLHLKALRLARIVESAHKLGEDLQPHQ